MINTRSGVAGRGRGRGRGRGGASSRNDDAGGGRQESQPPSRNLWVGNLSFKIQEHDLTRHFAEFGDLDRVLFQSRRSYAFISFKNDEDAIAAYKVLQGFPIDGYALRIEYAKAVSLFAADKSSASRDEDYTQPNPTDVLWIGFPAILKVDEAILRKAFSPFGEIEKVTVFPGRSYAFVRFGALSSALRAKETLQGKLFGNPRVRICYSKNEGEPRSPLLAGDSSDVGGGGYDFVDGGKGSRFDSSRFEQELGPPPNAYERRGGTLRGVGRKSLLSYEDDHLDLPAVEDSPQPFTANKKLKMGSSEYDLPEHHLYSGAADQESQRAPQGEPLLHIPAETKVVRGSSEPTLPKPSLKLWQWEGAIAKGGSLVCQARAFPVGKSMEIMLPGYLDCTARTSLDMLAKHYYQAASAWVIFFVPASDADMGHYNEYMHHLGEKQRAAVAKLDESTTLFLVPPSEFSKKVLKVPGDMSISGVVLRLEPLVPNTAVNPPPEPKVHLQGDAHMPYKAASLPQPDSLAMPPTGFSGSVHPSHGGSLSYPDVDDHRNEYLPPREGALREQSSGQYAGETSDDMSIQQQPTPASPPPPLAAAGLLPNQLPQLVSSLLGQQSQLGGSNPDPSTADDHRQGSSAAPEQTQGVQTNNNNNNQQQQQNVDTSSQYGQLQQLQQQTESVLTAINRELQSASAAQGGAAGSQEGGAADAKRIGATLELAATLLKQIQQGKVGP